MQLGKEMREGAVPELCKTVNGEQNLNEKWLFISFYKTKNEGHPAELSGKRLKRKKRRHLFICT